MNHTSPPEPPPRLAPEETFPPYSYVTGRFPHPTRDPQGHSFGHVAPAAPAIDPERWADSREYLFGCDLFNYGYYWEAHELWESSWKACGRTGTTANLLKGLIKLAAAGVKAREGRVVGVQRHAARAAELFASVRSDTGSDHYLGLSLARLIAVAQTLQAQPTARPVTDGPVELVFGFHLVPRSSRD